MSLQRYQTYLDEVRRASPIEEVVRNYVGDRLLQRGDRLVCCSPFRDEKDPSFYVFPSQGTWWDFGSHEGTDCFDLVQKCENVGFKESVDILAERAGIDAWKSRANGSANDASFAEEIDAINARRRVEKIQTLVALHYHSMLPDAVRDFLRKNYGFTDKTIDAERIGWCDGSFVSSPAARGFTAAQLLETGLFRPSKNGRRLYEVHGERVTFPYNLKGAVPYMISRRVEGVTPDTEWQKQKYKKSLVHSSNHPYVSKHVGNRVFSGEDSLRRSPKTCLITEGTTDRISASQCGYAAISPNTTTFKKTDLERAFALLSKVAYPVVINDEEEPRVNPSTGEVTPGPGFVGALKTAKALFFAGLTNVRVARLPRSTEPKVDVCSFVVSQGPDALRRVVDSALTYPRVLLEEIPPGLDPSEWDLHLFPVYEALALLPPRAREGYVAIICKELGLTKKVVRDDLAEFLKGKQPPADVAPPSVPPPAATQPPSDGGPSSAPRIRGHIFESPDGYYYTYSKDGVVERVSNFVLRPHRSVKVDGDERLGVDIRIMSGSAFKDCLLPPNSFHSERDLVRALQSVSKRLAWSGTSANVQGLVQHLAGHVVPDYRGVKSLGYVSTEAGPRWVTSENVYSRDGLVADPHLTYAPYTVPPLASRLDFGTAEFDPSLAAGLAQRILPKVFELNDAHVIIPLLGWFYASSLAPEIRRIAGYFPLMWVWGTQGSSKTSTSRDIFWRLLGVKGEPFSCSDTPFAMLINASSSSSIPVLWDEFKSDLPKTNYDRVCRTARKAYGGEDESRGRADLKVNVYTISSPLCIVGEQMPTDAALRERILVASPRKPALTRERRMVFAEVSQAPLSSLAGPWVRYALSVDVEKAWADAQAFLRSMLTVNRISPRIRDNLTAMVMGNALFDSWAESLGVDLSRRPKVRDHIASILGAITESDGSGVVKSAADSFLEDVSTYARLGALENGREYAVVNGELCLHLRSCYEVYLQERRKSGRADATNGYASLRRAFSESHEESGYVTHLAKRVAMPVSGSFIRAVTISLAKLPEGLDVDFRETQSRQWGGSRSFHETDSN